MPTKIPARFTKTERDTIVMEYKGGATRRALGRKWGTKTETIGLILRAEGCELRPHFTRKVGTELQERIVADYKSGRSLKQIAADTNLAPQTIAKHLRRAGVSINPKGARFIEIPANKVAEIDKLWRSGMSQEKVAKMFGTTQGKISNLLARHGYSRASRSAKGIRHGMWKGGVISVAGYRFVRIESDDPLIEMAQQSGYVAEHRLVAARFLGRPLRSTETVHHINGNRLDNRLENLQIRQGKHGKGVAYRCCDCGSHNVEPAPLIDDDRS